MSVVGTVTIGRQKLSVTPVFNAYWRFAAERQIMFYRRLKGLDGPLTGDPILKRFKFTNAYRASDRVSQYLIRNVIYCQGLTSNSEDAFFRIILFKIFNKIETWLFLEELAGLITWESYRFSDFDRLLTHRMRDGHSIYSAAYIMPSAGRIFGHALKHQNHLKMIEQLMARKYSSRLLDCKSMAEAFALLQSVPFLGPFLAYQYATDLNYSELTQFREDEFVVAGPGAIDGMNKCFVNTGDMNPSDIIRYMFENQERHFGELGITFNSLWGRSLQLIDCQNLFCEISKYARVAFPDYAGVAGRTRIKQKFLSRGKLPEPWYPPKWKIDTQHMPELI